MRKRVMGMAAVAVAAAIAVPTVAFAGPAMMGATAGHDGNQGNAQACANGNGNGACDKAGACDGSGNGNGALVDTDGDGVCDNRADGVANGNGPANGSGAADGTGAGNQFGSQAGTCEGNGAFADADADGICDNAGTGSCTTPAGGMQRHHGNR